MHGHEFDNITHVQFVVKKNLRKRTIHKFESITHVQFVVKCMGKVFNCVETIIGPET